MSQYFVLAHGTSSHIRKPIYDSIEEAFLTASNDPDNDIDNIYQFMIFEICPTEVRVVGLYHRKFDNSNSGRMYTEWVKP